MILYLAGSWKQKRLIHAAHDYTRGRGFTVISTWTQQRDIDDYSDAELQACAQADWAELCAADTLIYCNFNGGVKSEGKATELGGALMAGKRVLLVGPRESNIFLRLPQVEQYQSLKGALDALAELAHPV